ncbi:MAG: GAP family protein [Mycobacterium sp.]|uniref:GAP family protein n=1 Tax=Mycobacterium sp. TaxID=1785 RepID=UPI003F9E8134
MWYLVLMFAITAAQDPVRIGVTALLVARPRSMHNLLAYWLGLMITGFGAALASLFLLDDFLMPITRALGSAFASPIVPPIQVVLGVVAISVAAMLAVRSPARQAAPAAVAAGDSSVLVLEPHPPKPPTMFSRLSERLSWTSRLEGRSVGMSFIAGLFTSTQIVEFSGAMMVIVASRATALMQIAAALVFTLVAFAITEIPLVCHLVSPARTQVVVTQVHSWLCAHRRPIIVFGLGCFGFFLTLKGLNRL